MWLLLLACAEPPSPVLEGRIYADALQRMRSDRDAAYVQCASLREAALHDDCLTALAEERLARGEDPAAAALCEEMVGANATHECYFQLAERQGAANACDKAGPYAEDCRMHIWGRSLMRQLRPPVDWADAEARLPGLIATAGFALDDERPWFAAYRHLHNLRPQLRRADCNALPADHRTLCEDAAKRLYEDLANHARDTGTLPCPGQPISGNLDPGDDPIFAAVLADRRSGRCP